MLLRVHLGEVVERLTLAVPVADLPQDPQRPPEAADGILIATLAGVGQAEVVLDPLLRVAISKLSRDPQRLLEAVDGLVEALILPVHDAQLLERQGHRGLISAALCRAESRLGEGLPLRPAPAQIEE